MLLVARVLAFLVGSTVVLGTVASAIKTVVVPRGEPAMLTRWVFTTLRRPFDLRVRRAKTWQAADRIMSRFAPFGLALLPATWLTVTLLAFVPIYWALGHDAVDGFILSGSSLLTLGFRFDDHGPVVAASFVEATIGLGLIGPAHRLPAVAVPAVLPP